MTGIDRVELAYLERFLSDQAPVWFLCRLPKSYALLDRKGGQEIVKKLRNEQPWGDAGMAALLAYSSAKVQQKSIADVWRQAVGTASVRGLGRLLVKHLPAKITYYNVGHSNLRTEVFEAVGCISDKRNIVFIHDIIPISSPEFSTSGNCKKFEKNMQVVAKYADALIYNSETTQAEAEAWFTKNGHAPSGIVGHLGSGSERSKLPIMAADKKPTFVVLGTIEPRKNHKFLLQIWKEFHEKLPVSEIPELHIIGRRGWKNEDVFEFLNSDGIVGKTVFEHNELDDETAQKMLAKSWGLLFPSLQEGFGLPLIEAAQVGVPVFCGENAIYREILGDYPLYLNVDNSYLWAQRILERAGCKRESEAERQVRARTVKIPTWDQHFDRIFRIV